MAKSSKGDFLEEVAAIIRAKFPLVKLEKNEADFALAVNGHWVAMENLYRISAENKNNLQRHVERWIVELLRAAEGTPDQRGTFDELKERIMPVVISAGRRDVAGKQMVQQQILEGLFVGYAIDSKHTISYIPQDLFDSWKISLDELHEVALENLVTKSAILQAQAVPDDHGNVNLVLIQTLDGYDASRILLPGLHEHLREHLGTPFLSGIPNRDILVCFRNDPETLDRLAKQIKEDFKAMPHQVTDQVFLITSDGIAVFKG